MNINISAIIGTIFTGLLIAGILGWIRKPRLIVHIPRLLSHSWLSEKGKLVELSIFNRGFKTEESIEIVLNKSLSYNLIGSNNQDAEILNNKVKIPRIGSSDETTIIFLIEGGEFSPKDVTSCLSKETKGRIVEKFEEIPVTWQIRVTGIIVIFFVIAIAYGAYFLYTDSITLEKRANTDAGKIEQSIAQSTSAIKENLDAIQSTLTKSSATDSVNGWTIPDYYKTTSDPLYQALKSSKIQINVQGDVSENGK